MNSMPLFSSKMPNVGTTIFTVMTNLANQQNALNLSQGFPDFDAPAELIDLVKTNMHKGFNQYAPMQGVLGLREKIAEKVQTLYQAQYNPITEITVTSGATEALFAAITAFIHKDDQVIVFEPAYDAYVPVIELNGGIPVFIKMNESDFSIDWTQVKDAITPKTKMMILNSPHNPSGTILKQQDIDALIEIVNDTGIVILSDEVYEHIIFDGQIHHSMSRYPQLAQRSLVVSSFGKTYHTTGWKIGYCLAPKELSLEFQKVHQFLTFASNTPIQYAYAQFMEHKDHYMSLAQFYQSKRDLFLNLIKKSRFKPVPCQGTYFQSLDYSNLSDLSDIEYSKALTIEHKIASIPTSVFFHDNTDCKILRFCFAKRDDTLEKAARILCNI